MKRCHERVGQELSMAAALQRKAPGEWQQAQPRGWSSSTDSLAG